MSKVDNHLLAFILLSFSKDTEFTSRCSYVVLFTPTI
jgi:hypothetical protein